MRKPACFVAMALGRPDIEDLLTKSIIPVLRQLDIRCIVANRREDNRDITFQIMEQLGRADLCIADLTYARPSVYFEAGYAQRGVEVIYTARRDHLSRGGDEHRRIHFDLEHKPIVDWLRPTSLEFQRRLRKRIRHTFLNRWRKANSTFRAEERARAAFARLSDRERRLEFLHHVVGGLSKVGFRGVPQGGDVNPETPVLPAILFLRKRDASSDVVICMAPEAGLLPAIRQSASSFALRLVIEGALRKKLDRHPPTRVRGVLVLLSGVAVRPATVSRVLPDWKPLEDGTRWVATETHHVTLGSRIAELQEELVVLGGLRSKPECRKAVAELIGGPLA